jgi:hypothetical protein
VCRPLLRAVTAVLPLEVVKGVNHVLEAVHVVSVDVPVAEVTVRLVLDVPDVGGHDLPRDVLLGNDAFLEHGNLELTENLKIKITVLKSVYNPSRFSKNDIK